MKKIKTAAVIGFMLAAGMLFACSERGSADEDVISGAGLETERADPEETLSTETEKLVVHVCGAVNDPDVYELESGSRVLDAVKTAGGLREDASADYLNMAEKVYDGEKIFVPTQSQAEAGGILPEAGGSGSKININTADEETLTKLKGIGDARAADIIRYREEHGSFGSIEDIMKVPGIKEKAFSGIKEDITV